MGKEGQARKGKITEVKEGRNRSEGKRDDERGQFRSHEGMIQ